MEILICNQFKFTHIRKKLLIFLMLCVLSIGMAHAQNRQVSGKVTSASDGQPIAGATVTAVGTTIATQTDPNGNYSIEVAGNAVLSFSYLGFETQRVNVDNRS